jgi:hypothetical protein
MDRVELGLERRRFRYSFLFGRKVSCSDVVSTMPICYPFDDKKEGKSANMSKELEVC